MACSDDIKEVVAEQKGIHAITGDYYHVAFVRADGTVCCLNQYNDYLSTDSSIKKIKSWNNIVDVASCDHFVVTLKSDGTVDYIDSNRFSRLKGIDNWKEIKSIDCSFQGGLVGLMSNGTVVTSGRVRGFPVEKWTNIVGISVASAYDDFGRSYEYILAINSWGMFSLAGTSRYQQRMRLIRGTI